MKMLFCNIGWTERYRGDPGDETKGGGAYNKDRLGHEAYNFSKVDDFYYGYVQLPGEK